MTLHTSTIVVPKPKSRIWAKVGENTLFAVGLPILLLVIWGVWGTLAPAKFFPNPAVIARAFAETWIGPAFVNDVVPSLSRLLLGIVLSIVVGVAGGAVIGRVRWLREMVTPVLEFFRAIPPPALIPVVVLLLGATDAQKVVVIVAGAVWPVLLNTIDGVKSTDSVMQDTSTSFSLSRYQNVRYLILPAASPRIIAGVRQTLSISLIMMVISELFFSGSGLGYQIGFFQRNYLIAEMWSGIVLLGLVGVLLAVLFGFVERRVLRWYHGVKEVERA